MTNSWLAHQKKSRSLKPSGVCSDAQLKSLFGFVPFLSQLDNEQAARNNAEVAIAPVIISVELVTIFLHCGSEGEVK